MRKWIAVPRARGALLACVLTVPAVAGAIDGLPIAVELTNADEGSVGWVRIADDDGLEPQVFTIEAWVTPLGTAYSGTGAPVGARIVTKPMEGQVGNNLSSYTLGLNLDGTVVAFVAHQLGVAGSSVQSDAAVPEGTRAHVAMSFDGTWLRIFINGQLDDEVVASAGTVDYGAQDVLIGAANFGSGYLRLFRGIVDDVRIWDHARSAAEIAAQMDCSLDGTEPGLLAYYSFNAGDLRDDSAHGHDGVADGSVGFVTSNDACLPFVADLESGDLSEWSGVSAP